VRNTGRHALRLRDVDCISSLPVAPLVASTLTEAWVPVGCVLSREQAHGKLHDAIRNGGCGFSFSWSTGKAAATSFHNLANVQVTGNPATMYPTEIKELRRTLGITSTAV